MKNNIVLIGPMGSGKTTLGQAVSHISGFPFIDTDNVIVERSGMTIPHIFAQYGESYFREMEAAAAESVARRRQVVIATGGGMVLSEINMTRLRATGLVVYLRCDVKTLLARVGADTNRPLLGEARDEAALRERMDTLLTQRGPLYERYSDFILDTGEGDTTSLARQLWTARERYG